MKKLSECREDMMFMQKLWPDFKPSVWTKSELEAEIKRIKQDGDDDHLEHLVKIGVVERLIKPIELAADEFMEIFKRGCDNRWSSDEVTEMSKHLDEIPSLGQFLKEFSELSNRTCYTVEWGEEIDILN